MQSVSLGPEHVFGTVATVQKLMRASVRAFNIHRPAHPALLRSPPHRSKRHCAPGVHDRCRLDGISRDECQECTWNTRTAAMQLDTRRLRHQSAAHAVLDQLRTVCPLMTHHAACVQYDKDLKLLLTARYFTPSAAERAQQRVVASRRDELAAANALSRLQVPPAKVALGTHYDVFERSACCCGDLHTSCCYRQPSCSHIISMYPLQLTGEGLLPFSADKQTAFGLAVFYASADVTSLYAVNVSSFTVDSPKSTRR